MNIKNICAAFLAFVIGITAFIITLKINISQKYSNFIVGHIAWNAENKNQDLAAWPVFIFVFFLSFIILQKKSLNFHYINKHDSSSQFINKLVFKNMEKISSALSKLILNFRGRYGAALSSRLATQLILWSVPFYAALSALFRENTIDSKTIAISALGIAFIGIVSFLIKKKEDEINPDLPSITFLTVILISLIPFELGLLIGRLPINLIGEINLNFLKKTVYLLVVLGFCAAAYALISHRARLNRNLSRIIFISQIGLPFFFLTLYPARLLQPSGEVSTYNTTIYLKIFVVSLVIFSLYDVINRFQTHSKGDRWEKLVSPLAIFGLLVALKLGNTIAPNISSDDYHFGESLLGWWSYMNGAIPYVNYIPAHGLIDDDLRMLLSYIFYDGSAASIAEAGRLSLAILGFFAFLSIYYFSGSILLSFTIILLLSGRLGWFFLIPFICLWCDTSLKKNPKKWLTCWILTSPIVILGIPPQGLLLVIASSIMTAKLSLDFFRIGNKRDFVYILFAPTLLLVLFCLTPLLQMLLGAIRYVLENGLINQIAYGIPWSISWNGEAKSTIFESIRMSWVAILVFCIYIIYIKRKEFKKSSSLLYPAVTFAVFILLLIPYSMGRIDPGSLSRAGAVSIFSWVAILPIFTWNLFYNNRAILILIVAFSSSIFGNNVASYSSIVSSISAAVHTETLIESDKFGLPNIGNAHIDESHLNRITRLNTLLNSKLKVDEPYIDLTSRNAHYFYVNRRPIIPITAPYNLVSPIQQLRVIQNIDNLPKIALLSADNIAHDGGGLALRNPYIYRFIMENYEPRSESGFIVGYKKEKGVKIPQTEIIAEIKNITDDNWVMGTNRYAAAFVLNDPLLVSVLNTEDHIRLKNGNLRRIKKVSIAEGEVWLEGEHLSPSESGYPNMINIVSNNQTVRDYQTSLFHAAFSVSDYHKIPTAWGKSENSLKNKMNLVRSLDNVPPTYQNLYPKNGSYTVSGVDPQLIFNISGFDLGGHDAGLLRFDFSCVDKNAAPRLQVFWWGDEHEGPFESSSIKFSADDGTLIIPLDASPWWLCLDNIKGIRIDLDNENACKEFSIKNIGLYQRIL